MPEGYDIGLGALLLVASVTDLIWGKIFNAINLFFLAGGLFYHFINGTNAIPAAVAVGVAFVLFYPLYLIRAMTAGDVKLLMAAGAWSEPKTIVELGLLAILVGGLVGALVLARKLGVRGGIKNVWQAARPKNELVLHRMPFAPAFLCAFLCLHVIQRWGWL
jgi:Flp pilus assembly protein protease CpaA